MNNKVLLFSLLVPSMAFCESTIDDVDIPEPTPTESSYNLPLLGAYALPCIIGLLLWKELEDKYSWAHQHIDNVLTTLNTDLKTHANTLADTLSDSNKLHIETYNDFNGRLLGLWNKTTGDGRIPQLERTIDAIKKQVEALKTKGDA